MTSSGLAFYRIDRPLAGAGSVSPPKKNRDDFVANNVLFCDITFFSMRLADVRRLPRFETFAGIADMCLIIRNIRQISARSSII